MAAWKRAAPWMPPKVEPLQLSVSDPSLLAAAASAFKAAFISWAGAGVPIARVPIAVEAAMAMPVRHDRTMDLGTFTSGRCPDSEVRIIVRNLHLRTSESKDTSNLLAQCGFGSEVRMTNLRQE